MGYDTTYIAVDNYANHIIASAIVSYSSSENTQGLLHALVVAKEHRNKTIASNLITEIISTHTSVICFANESLQPFYHKFGFELVIADNSFITQTNLIRYNAYKKQQKTLAIFIYNPA